MSDLRAHPDRYDPLFVSQPLDIPRTTHPNLFALPSVWREALTARDAKRCHQMAAEAGAAKEFVAVRALCILAETESNWQSNLWGRRKAWRWARIAGINALARIGDKAAIPTLVRALFDPDPHICETAAYELPTFGQDVVPVLRQCLREASDWTLNGMQAAIGILEKMGEPAASAELAQVIAEQLPGDPARWARQTFVRPFTLVAGLFCIAWSIALFHTTADPSIPVWESGLETGISIAVADFVPLVFLYMMLVCVVFLPLLNLRSARERGHLAQSAVKALGCFHDKRPLPLLMDLAFGPRTLLARTARTALRRLLPLLDAADAEQLSSRTRHQLAQALGKSEEPDMDLALLNALEQVGLGQAAEAIQVLARKGRTTAVRERAANLLPLFQERQRAETACASLLRPGAAPVANAGELLRATGISNPLPASQMLRPSSGSDLRQN